MSFRREKQQRSGSCAGNEQEPPGGRQALAEIGSRLNVDLSEVRLAEDGQAESMGAEAFTRGHQIHLARGRVDGRQRRGFDLLGHEVGHVLQQSQGQVGGSQGSHVDDSRLEQQADRLGETLASGSAMSARSLQPGGHAIRPFDGPIQAKRTALERRSISALGYQQVGPTCGAGAVITALMVKARAESERSLSSGIGYFKAALQIVLNKWPEEAKRFFYSHNDSHQEGKNKGELTRLGQQTHNGSPEYSNADRQTVPLDYNTIRERLSGALREIDTVTNRAALEQRMTAIYPTLNLALYVIGRDSAQSQQAGTASYSAGMDAKDGLAAAGLLGGRGSNSLNQNARGISGKFDAGLLAEMKALTVGESLQVGVHVFDGKALKASDGARSNHWVVVSREATDKWSWADQGYNQKLWGKSPEELHYSMGPYLARSGRRKIGGTRQQAYYGGDASQSAGYCLVPTIFGSFKLSFSETLTQGARAQGALARKSGSKADKASSLPYFQSLVGAYLCEVDAGWQYFGDQLNLDSLHGVGLKSQLSSMKADAASTKKGVCVVERPGGIFGVFNTGTVSYPSYTAAQSQKARVVDVADTKSIAKKRAATERNAALKLKHGYWLNSTEYASIEVGVTAGLNEDLAWFGQKGDHLKPGV